jgi:hypothetical protein
MESVSRHQCLIYEGSPLQQLPALAAVIQQKLRENFRCLYLNSPSMVAGMRSCLETLKVDVANEVTKTRLVLSPDPVTSADGGFDVDLMIRNLGDAVEQSLKDGYAGLFATGDMTWEFGAKENFTKLLEYEWKLEKMFHKQPHLCGICQYHQDTLPREVMRQGLLSHRAVFVNETLARVNEYYSDSVSGAEEASKDPELDNELIKFCRARDMA